MQVNGTVLGKGFWAGSLALLGVGSEGAASPAGACGMLVHLASPTQLRPGRALLASAAAKRRRRRKSRDGRAQQLPVRSPSHWPEHAPGSPSRADPSASSDSSAEPNIIAIKYSPGQLCQAINARLVSQSIQFACTWCNRLLLLVRAPLSSSDPSVGGSAGSTMLISALMGKRRLVGLFTAGGLSGHPDYPEHCVLCKGAASHPCPLVLPKFSWSGLTVNAGVYW